MDVYATRLNTILYSSHANGCHFPGGGNSPTLFPMKFPQIKIVSEGVEFNYVPPDTTSVISEADTPWESCTSPIQ